MRKINVLSSSVQSKRTLSEDKIRTFNEKMRKVAAQAAENAKIANERAALVLLTR